MSGAGRLGREFFARDAASLARALLGVTVVRMLDGERLAARIVETEAYVGVEDRAAHSFGGRRTARTEPMFGEPGTLYVYFTYGMHHCMNVVCGAVDEPVAVLLRGAEALEGVQTMRRLRGEAGLKGGSVQRRNSRSKSMSDSDLCRGPANLCRALGVGRELSGVDVIASEVIWLEGNSDMIVREEDVGVSPRVGVSYAGEWANAHLRWFMRNSASVSGRRR